MDFEKWVEGYKVRVFPWVDGKTFYINVQYYAPGSSLSQPPAMEKTVYLTDNENGRNMIQNFLSSLILHIARMEIPDGHKIILTA